MAVDLIITPLSKYWSGEYITPVMKDAWEMGAEYKVMSPDGVKTIPEGNPYGGEKAKDERVELITFVEEIMEALPFEGASGAWNEKLEHFGFYRIDPDTFGEVAQRANKQFTKKVSLIGRFKGNKEKVSHLGSALIFIPINFESPFDLEGKAFASLPSAMKELESGDWDGIPVEELRPIIQAFKEAIRENLPLVVDL